VLMLGAIDGDGNLAPHTHLPIYVPNLPKQV
jgi:hypothetical protein